MQADVDQLTSFQSQVLFGDLVNELDEDPGLHVHDNHVTAFQLSQFSAQYLSHCVDTLAARCEEYSDQYSVLANTRSDLLRSRSQLVRSRVTLGPANWTGGLLTDLCRVWLIGKLLTRGCRNDSVIV